jgi:DNA polymerase-3 subunit gamma/tau
MIKSFNAAATDLRGGWQPSLPLELALAESLEMPAQAAPSEARPVVKVPTGKTFDRPVEKSILKVVDRPAEKPVSAPAQATEKPVEKTGAINLEQLTKAWKQIRTLIKPQSPSLDGLLNSCKLLEVKNGALVIGFASELLRSKVETPEMIEITRKAIAEVSGSDLAIKCVVTNAKQANPPNVKADGMVAAALKHGGEIVDTQE